MSDKSESEDTTAEVVHKEEAEVKADVASEEKDIATDEATDAAARDDPVDPDVDMKKESKDDDEYVEVEEVEEPRRTRPKRKAAQKSAMIMKKTKKEREEKPKKTGTSGFSKPVKVSEELADFLGQDEISRPQLTKFMWQYFKDNELQDPRDKRLIIADDKLKELLKVDRFNAFGFMKLVKPHLIG